MENRKFQIRQIQESFVTQTTKIMFVEDSALMLFEAKAEGENIPTKILEPTVSNILMMMHEYGVEFTPNDRESILIIARHEPTTGVIIYKTALENEMESLMNLL